MGSEQRVRLDSWKEIAAYLGRDVSTVIRWEKEKGLPVYRLPGGKRQAVFALKEEIDAWLTGQPIESPDRTGEPSPPPPDAGPTLPSTPAPAYSWLRHWMTPWLLTTAVLFVASVAVFRTGRGSGPETPTAGEASTTPAYSPPGVLAFQRQDVPLASPYTAVTADFDQDGNLDLAVTSYHENCVFILQGGGDGTFGKEVPFPVGVHPDGIATADFDGDGRLDLATGNRGSDSVSVLLGNGDGTFQTRVDLAVGKDPRGVATGDFDGNSKADLVAALYGSDTVSILAGFARGLKLEASQTAGVSNYQVAVGDFNSDGRPDVAVGNTFELKEDQSPPPPFALLILLGDGKGNFRQHWKGSVGTGSTGITTADFNRDGKLDVAVTGFLTHACFVLLGNGDGTFREPLKLPAGIRPLAAATGDLDGDGNLDVVVANSHSGNLSVFRGNGDGTFAEKVDFQTGGYPKSLVVTDFNRDGRADIVVTNFVSNSYSVLLNTTRQ